MILAGDIGGTKVNLALFQDKNGTLVKVEEVKFESRKYSALEEILDEFLRQQKPKLDRAGFGIAGPVKDGKCDVTNLHWVVDAENLKSRLGLDVVWLINDLAAMACAVPFLDENKVEVLQAGREETGGRIAVIAAGTGLGEALLMPGAEGRYYVLDTEGGHCDFAPRTLEETDFLHFLLKEHFQVSIEHVLSGPGLRNIYQFVNERQSIDEPDWLAREIAEGDPGVVITRNGLEKKSPACQKALDLFASIYGAVAGNLALQFLPAGGVYLGGGIAPKIISLLKNGAFMNSFLNKGRFKPYLSQVPVKVILDEKASLLGAAHYALGGKFVR